MNAFILHVWCILSLRTPDSRKEATMTQQEPVATFKVGSIWNSFLLEIIVC